MKVIAVIGLLVIVGAAAWLYLFRDAPAPSTAALKPQAQAGAPAPAPTAPPAVQADKAASPPGGTSDPSNTLRPSSGKHYTDKQLQDVLAACVLLSFTEAGQQKSLVSRCEEVVKLHQSGNEAQASAAMGQVSQSMAGLQTQDPWQSDVPPSAVALVSEGKDARYKDPGKPDFAAEIDIYKQALKIKPDYYTANRNMAYALSSAGDQPRFAEYGGRAFALAEKHGIRDFEYYAWYAGRLNTGGNVEQARDVLQKGLKLDPGNAHLLGALQELGKRKPPPN